MMGTLTPADGKQKTRKTKQLTSIQALWYRPVITATWGAGSGGLQVQDPSLGYQEMQSQPTST